MHADWEGEASKAAAIATEEEEAVLERHSIDIARHPENGLREPLLANGAPDEGQHGCGQEDQTEACCRGGAASGAAPIVVVAECGAAAAPGDAEASNMNRTHRRDVHDG